MNTRHIALALVCAVCSLGLTAQEDAVADTTWKSGGLIGATFGQTSLSNWAGGGFSSISANGTINLFANMLKGKNAWDNNLDLGYGLLKQGEDDVAKTDDRIDFTTKYGRQAWSPKWYYSALGNFRTQFAEGFTADNDTQSISNAFAPAYGLASLGLDYKANDKFSVYFSPATAKFTYVGIQRLADAGAFGVTASITDDEGNFTPGENLRSEVGGYLRAAFADNIMENVTFASKLDLFSNYDNPEYIDVNFDVLIGMKVNDYITATLGATALYDHDIRIAQEGLKADGSENSARRTQLRQVFGVGFAYAL